jgi:uncharacterized damage-inducible protein DinB
MNKNDVEQLYEYNRWANARVLDAASGLTAEQFVKDLSGSFVSVRDTLTHILAAEQLWLERWNGVSPKSFLAAADFPDAESLRAKWGEVEKGQAEFIARLAEGSLARVISYRNIKGEELEYTLEQMMQHLANHSSYHRGQVNTMLRQLGGEAAPVDLLLFVNMKSASR